MAALYALLENLRDENSLPDIAIRNDLIRSCGHQRSWSSLCVNAGTPDSDPAHAISYFLGDSMDPAKEASHVLERLVGLFRIINDLNEFSKEQFEAVLNRIGLPLHYRLAHDRGMGKGGGEQNQIARCWDVIAEDAELSPNPLAIGAADAYWIWQHIVASTVIERINTIQTRIVLVRESDEGEQEGVSATLTGSLIRWPQNAPLPRYRFVANPKSFGWIVEPTFFDSFDNTYQYLSKEVGIWPNDLVIEWNVSDVTGPILSGGSAGAAIALVAGGLLAKQHLEAGQ